MNNKGNAKTVYLVIIAVIATVCIVAGASRHFVNGVRFSVFPFVNIGGHYSNTMDDDETEKYESFDRVSVDVSIGDLSITEGDEYSVSYRYNGVEAPRVSVEDGELKIVQTGKAFAINLQPNMSGRIDITIPKDAVIEDMDIENDLGNIEIDGVSAEDVRINASMGDIKVSNGTFEDMDIDESMGDVDLIGITAKSVKVDNSMGDIKAEGFFNRFTADDSMGDIKVENENDSDDVRIELDTSLGEVKYNGDRSGTHYYSH